MNNEAMKQFGDMDRSEKLELLAAWIDGKEIQVFIRSKQSWEVCGPMWSNYNTYRVKPMPVISLDWSAIDPMYQYAAMDEKGGVYVYVVRPSINPENSWWSVPHRSTQLACQWAFLAAHQFG